MIFKSLTKQLILITSRLIDSFKYLKENTFFGFGYSPFRFLSVTLVPGLAL